MVKATFFHTKNGMVTSTDPGWLQSAFDFLMGLFDRVGLHRNFCKTVGMVCRPFREDRVRAYKSYTQRMMVEGRSFKEQKRDRIS